MNFRRQQTDWLLPKWMLWMEIISTEWQAWNDHCKAVLFQKNSLRIKFMNDWTIYWMIYQWQLFRYSSTQNESFKKMKWHVDFVKTKSNLITQIQTKKIELMKFLHERKMSKHIIINCGLILDAFDIWLMIENDEKRIYKKLMFNFIIMKVLIQWFIKFDLLSMFFYIKTQFY